MINNEVKWAKNSTKYKCNCLFCMSPVTSLKEHILEQIFAVYSCEYKGSVPLKKVGQPKYTKKTYVHLQKMSAVLSLWMTEDSVVPSWWRRWWSSFSCTLPSLQQLPLQLLLSNDWELLSECQQSSLKFILCSGWDYCTSGCHHLNSVDKLN